MINYTHDEIIALDQQYIMNTYGRYPLVPKCGKGAVMTDADGKEYVDFGSGIGVNALGYSNEKWVEAVTEQLKSFQHVSNYFYCPSASIVASKLVPISGLSKMFFGNSGAEANEGAIKVARKYSSDKYGKDRYTIITLVNSFHGRTVTTLSATGQDVFHQYFDPFTTGFKHVPINDLEALKAELTDDVCAIMCEPIQGEGGVNLMDEAYAKEVRKLCDEKDLLLMFDEVQCGIGRTGTMFAYQQLGVTPDVVTLAKGLGGGLPIGAFICSEKCASVLGRSQHGTTFGANPVSNAGAVAVLEALTDEFLAEVTAKGEYIRKAVASWNLPCVKDIRGRGLMIGVQVDCDPHDIGTKCFNSGLLILSAGKDVVRMLPPLNITYEEIDRGLAILKDCMG